MRGKRYATAKLRPTGLVGWCMRVIANRDRMIAMARPERETLRRAR